MQTNVCPISGDFVFGGKTREFVNAIGGVMPAQDTQHLSAMPTSLTKFKRVSVRFGKRFKKLLQPFGVAAPLGRKLKQDWAKLLLKLFGARQQIFESVFRVFQLLVVGQEATGLYGEEEVWRRSFTPT